MEIQNAALGEHKLRDLNDEINKLIREKGHWERRILELGGPDYRKVRAIIDLISCRGCSQRAYLAAPHIFVVAHMHI